ncbi:hypothetical protein GDO78_020112 [Eleutherodactylus coqui]|uniref:Uncharacterized protein n=1 Tax=Eleutherodactylus coqui TaxID=57060 RepID=A0A8J6B094_ELECQ|nr:hypothetical protein GDO78_020112 [Eleutherodactylus coqui]
MAENLRIIILQPGRECEVYNGMTTKGFRQKKDPYIWHPTGPVWKQEFVPLRASRTHVISNSSNRRSCSMKASYPLDQCFPTTTDHVFRISYSQNTCDNV